MESTDSISPPPEVGTKVSIWENPAGHWPLRLALRMLRYALALGVALPVGQLCPLPVPRLELMAACIFYVLGIPYLMSLAVDRSYRFIVHTLCVLFFGGTAIAGILIVHTSESTTEGPEQSATVPMKADEGQR